MVLILYNKLIFTDFELVRSTTILFHLWIHRPRQLLIWRLSSCLPTQWITSTWSEGKLHFARWNCLHTSGNFQIKSLWNKFNKSNPFKIKTHTKLPKPFFFFTKTFFFFETLKLKCNCYHFLFLFSLMSDRLHL